MKRVLPPTYFLGAIILAVLLHFLVPVRQLLLFPWTLAGLAPLGAGIVLNLAADKTFKTRGTTVKPFEKPTSLVTDGVFAISRHPMYLGMTLVLAGIALLLGSVSSQAAVIALPILFDRLFIAEEEKMLEQSFGAEFRDYKRRVRRWV